METLTLGTFECFECGTTTREPLPPLEMVDWWPSCCERDSYLMTTEEVDREWIASSGPPAVFDRYGVDGLQMLSEILDTLIQEHKDAQS